MHKLIEASCVDAMIDLNLDSSLDWDLKNSKGVPIASGIYIVHIAAEGIGERTIKWFGVIRPIDLDTF